MVLLKILRLVALSLASPPEIGGRATGQTIKSGTVWLDTDGNPINAHGAGLLEHAGRWYWYGSRRQLNAPGTQDDGGITLYSSADLYKWDYEGLVLPVFNCTSPSHILGAQAYPPPNCSNGNGLDLERPKVVQCGGPGGKFVMWVRGTGYGNSPQLLAILISDNPTGPFTFVSNKTGSDDPFITVAAGIKNYPPGYQYADATLFQDPGTHKTYVYWRTRMTTGLDGSTGFRGMELTDDCLGVKPSSDTRITMTPNREAPAMFIHKGLYYLWVSDTMGWAPTLMFVYSATTPLGAFENSSMPHHGWHSYTKVEPNANSSSWNHTWIVRDGYLVAGYIFGNASTVNLTLTAAENLCAESPECMGFCFYDFDEEPPTDKVLSVALKTDARFVPQTAQGLQPPPIPGPGQEGNIAPQQPGRWAYDSQSTYILPNPHYVPGSKIAPFIYMGDRWDYNNLAGTTNATYVWLPLFVDPADPTHVSVPWQHEWRLDDPTLYPF